MKSHLLIALVLLFSQLKAENTRAITASSIKEVKVFLNGAQVSRTIRTNVDQGITQLAIDGLSSQIDASSIMVNGTGNAMIMSVGYTLDYLTDRKKPVEIRRLEDSMEILKSSLDRVTVQESVLNDEMGLLNANKNTGGSNTGVNAENLKKVSDYYRNRMTEIRLKLIDVNDDKKKINERIAKMNQQLNELNAKLNRPVGTVLVTISSAQPTSLDLNLTYYVNGANWRPVYDIRCTDVKGPVSLAYKAGVTQLTGEDWNNVTLSLSSSNPVLGGNKPELNPWYLNFYTPQPMYKNYNRSNAVQEAPAAMQSLELAKDGAVFTPPVVTNENQLETSFEIQTPYTINSDGKEVMVDVQKTSLPATYSYSAVPKMDRDAFLVAGITGWEQLSLLPGQANVYFENSYAGESYIDPSATTDTFKLSLGRDKRIVIKRSKVKELSTSKFIGSNIEKQFVYEITVRNTKKEEVTLTLEDQIPVSNSNEIKVTVDELSNGKMNPETGSVKWNVTVKPGETQKIRLGFTVRYPKDKVIGNL